MLFSSLVRSYLCYFLLYSAHTFVIFFFLLCILVLFSSFLRAYLCHFFFSSHTCVIFFFLPRIIVLFSYLFSAYLCYFLLYSTHNCVIFFFIPRILVLFSSLFHAYLCYFLLNSVCHWGQIFLWFALLLCFPKCKNVKRDTRGDNQRMLILWRTVGIGSNFCIGSFLHRLKFLHRLQFLHRPGPGAHWPEAKHLTTTP